MGTSKTRLKFPLKLVSSIATCSVLVLLNGSTSQAETISQIPAPFLESVMAGQITYQSQFDSMVDPLDAADGAVSNFATVYDDFTFTNSGLLTDFSWVGGYFSAGGTHADKFQVSIFSDDTSGTGGFASQPAAAPLYTIDAGMAGETLIPNNFFEYSAALPLLPVVAGQKYWFSVVAFLDADDPNGNDWGAASSDLGGGAGSFQDFQDFDGGTNMFLPVARFDDSHNYAFSVTAVPEPGSLLCLTAFTAIAGMRRRRRAS